MNKLHLISFMPAYYRNSNIMNSLMSVSEAELINIKNNLNNALNNLFIISTTTEIDKWEKVFGILSNDSKSIEQRRNIILAKLRSTRTTTKEVIKQVARAYFNTDKIEVTENYKEYEFTINIDWNGDSKFGDLEQSIQEIKPAHLNFKFAIKKSDEVNIATNFDKYEFKLNMCGTFNCGTVPEFSNQGITLNENLNVNSNNQNWIQKYKMCGGNGIDN